MIFSANNNDPLKDSAPAENGSTSPAKPVKIPKIFAAALETLVLSGSNPGSKGYKAGSRLISQSNVTISELFSILQKDVSPVYRAAAAVAIADHPECTKEQISLLSQEMLRLVSLSAYSACRKDLLEPETEGRRDPLEPETEVVLANANTASLLGFLQENKNLAAGNTSIPKSALNLAYKALELSISKKQSDTSEILLLAIREAITLRREREQKSLFLAALAMGESGAKLLLTELQDRLTRNSSRDASTHVENGSIVYNLPALKNLRISKSCKPKPTHELQQALTHGKSSLRKGFKLSVVAYRYCLQVVERLRHEPADQVKLDEACRIRQQIIELAATLAQGLKDEKSFEKFYALVAKSEAYSDSTLIEFAAGCLGEMRSARKKD
ncbi:MAG: hypothetical protein R3A13_05385 [Bdellovibrionota bacterium]